MAQHHSWVAKLSSDTNDYRWTCHYCGVIKRYRSEGTRRYLGGTEFSIDHGMTWTHETKVDPLPKCGDGSSLITVTLDLKPEQLASLDALAKERGIDRASVVRSAVVVYVGMAEEAKEAAERRIAQRAGDRP
jgi:hypothetical protein